MYLGNFHDFDMPLLKKVVCIGDYRDFMIFEVKYDALSRCLDVLV